MLTYLSSPSQNNLALVFTSKRLKERLLTASLGSWWQLIFLLVVATIPDSTGKWVKWVLLSLLLAYPYAHPLLVSNVSGVSLAHILFAVLLLMFCGIERW
jgi:hypothetical protein